jgi:hypothetical protein
MKSNSKQEKMKQLTIKQNIGSIEKMISNLMEFIKDQKEIYLDSKKCK